MIIKYRWDEKDYSVVSSLLQILRQLDIFKTYSDEDLMVLGLKSLIVAHRESYENKKIFELGQKQLERVPTIILPDGA